MTIARVMSVGMAVLAISGSAALAQQARTGMVTQINRLNNTVAIRQVQNGTVGANTAGAVEEFKVGSGISLDALHAGDRVSYSASDGDGAKTLTKIERQ
jgi:hypothetical protein